MNFITYYLSEDMSRKLRMHRESLGEVSTYKTAVGVSTPRMEENILDLEKDEGGQEHKLNTPT